MTSRLSRFGTTIFSEMTALAQQHDAVNLGQGFPDEDGPAEVLEAAQRAIRDGHNQYAPGPGIPELRHAVAEHGERFLGLGYDPDTEVSVTFGATEALSASVLGICDGGDEVVVVEPAYDAYEVAIALADARRVSVPLLAPDFRLDLDRLREVVTDRTRALILNSPHNPTGSALSQDELEAIAEVCQRHDVVVLSDEVYEHLRFDGEHRSIAQVDGMRERTIRISSSAKTFSVTGWKTGWACAPPELTRALRMVKSYTTFAGGTPFQHAVATALRLPDDYFTSLADDFAGRRDRLVAGLRDVGFDVTEPVGTYFVAADAAPLGVTDGVALARALPERIGVVAIPIGVFCEDPGPLTSWLRFATCKRPALLDEGIARLGRLATTEAAS